jgi:hypothetical protein
MSHGMSRPSARALAAALVLLAAAPVAASAASRRTIEDDYARALAEAKRRAVPILVDVWAPW